MDNSARIAEIREILQAGARQVTVDGTTVAYDFTALRQELRELMKEDSVLKHSKPRISSINLGNS